MTMKYWTEMPLGDMQGEPDMLWRQDQSTMHYECWDRLNRKWLVDPEGTRETGIGGVETFEPATKDIIDYWIEEWRQRGSRL